MAVHPDDYKVERSAILSLLKRSAGLTAWEISGLIQTEYGVVKRILCQMYDERLVMFNGDRYFIPEAKHDGGR